MKRFTSYLAAGVGFGLLSAAVLPAQPTGQWDFNSSNLNATVGANMQYVGGTAALTTFGTTDALGLPAINGTNATVMKFPASTNGSGGYNMPTPTPNGGGSGIFVHNYTIIWDILYPAGANNRVRPLVQTDDGFITAAADLIVGANNGLGITPGGPFTGTLLPNTWYRLAFVVDTANGFIRKYVNGAEVGTHNIAGLGLDHQYALTANALSRLFVNTGTNATEGYVNSIQIRGVALNGGQLAALGGPSADGILQNIPFVPSFIQTRAPGANATGVYPKPEIVIVLNRGDTTIDSGSVQLSFDGAVVGAAVAPAGDLINVTYNVPTLLSGLSSHTLRLVYSDSSAGFKTNTWTFAVTDYQSLNLPAPIHFESFDATAEGATPAGWVLTNATSAGVAGLDVGNPNSDSYRDFVVISSNRLATMAGWDGNRRVSLPPIAVNGQLLNRLVHGNVLYGESDVRGGSQVQVAFSPDYSLTGRSNVFVAWHSTYEQNQDNIASAEYSIDGGATWLPIVYMVDDRDPAQDLVRFPDGSTDALGTLGTARANQAHGLAYSNFIGAVVTTNLAPFISGRIDDDFIESKRVQLHRLPLADNQAAVRLRFGQAGTASWYFGIDDLGFYSINTPVISTQPLSQTVDAGTPVTFRVVAGGNPPLSYQWQFNGSAIGGATSSNYTVAAVTPANAGQYQVVVTNPDGPSSSGVVVLTVNTNPIIVAQPVAAVVDPNTSVSFGVTARGGQPLSYQWYKNSGVMGSATGTNFTIASAQAGDAGDYFAIVTNLYGSVTSRVVRLTVFSGSITQGLVAHLRFDGNNSDSSGRNNHGTAVGAPAFGPGKIGSGALDFTSLQNGSSFNYVTLGIAPDLQFGATNDFTITFWAKLPTNSWRNDPAFIGTKNWNSGGSTGYVMAANGGGEFQWNYREASPNDRKDYDHTTGIFSDHNWHHFTTVYTRGGRALTYVDGLLANSQILATGQNLPTSIDSGLPTNIGQDGTGSYTDGGAVGITNALIDDVGIWRRAVTPNEAASIYVQGSTGHDLTTATGAPPTLPPAITTQPQSVVASLGGSVSFGVVSGGTAPFTYVWQKNGTNIAGATSSNLTINPVQTPDIADYRAVVSNPAGSATSQVARLEVFVGTLGQGLVGYYKFDGDYRDASGRGNHGRAINAPTFEAGRVGQAVRVENNVALTVNNYVTLDYPSDLQFDTNSFSVSFWVNSTSATSDPSYISNKDWDSSSNLGWGFFAQSGGNLRIVVTGTPRGSGNRAQTSATPVVRDGAWHHVVTTFWRGQNMVTYVDGVVVNSTPLPILGSVDTLTNGAPATFSVNIGQDGSGNYEGQTLDALMDEVMLYRRVLTPQDVAALFTSGTQGQERILNVATITTAGGNVTLNWKGGIAPYTVQSKSALTNAEWVDVLTTSNQTATIPASGSQLFLRVVERVNMTVSLNGAHERPTPVVTGGTGSGTLVLDGNKLAVNVSYSGLGSAANNAHLHGPATSEQAAGVLVGLTPTGGTSGSISNALTLSAVNVERILQGLVYVNLHTVNNSGGEIRGQVLRNP